MLQDSQLPGSVQRPQRSCECPRLGWEMGGSVPTPTPPTSRAIPIAQREICKQQNVGNLVFASPALTLVAHSRWGALGALKHCGASGQLQLVSTASELLCRIVSVGSCSYNGELKRWWGAWSVSVMGKD